MISRREVIVWAIIGFANARPTSVRSSDTTTATIVGDSGNIPSVVVPQVGFLEERTDSDVNIGKGNNPPNNGIIVPIVSVIDAPHDNPMSGVSTAGNPLVALLPAPKAMDARAPTADSIRQEIPAVATLPIIQSYDHALPEIRRSYRDATGRINSVAYDRNEIVDSSETMDVAEDIVFRPLFRIRAGENNSGYRPNSLARNRNHGPNYRRYNVNGYYRLPYNYFRKNN